MEKELYPRLQGAVIFCQTERRHLSVLQISGVFLFRKITTTKNTGKPIRRYTDEEASCCGAGEHQLNSEEHQKANDMIKRCVY